ncbi:MAG: helix-turn-helix domain-containing protein [Rhodospirillales bacterium]|jgi:predicted DNA-binding transcriptional regulator AlpA|nr:helix-turn-helix domain-containing protein [Rhodospirillales bacterium]
MAQNAQQHLSRKALALKQANEQKYDTHHRRLIDEHEAAYRLGLMVTTLRRWRWAGKPPRFLKIGAAVRYDPEEIAEFIKAARRNSTSDTGRAVNG